MPARRVAGPESLALRAFTFGGVPKMLELPAVDFWPVLLGIFQRTRTNAPVASLFADLWQLSRLHPLEADFHRALGRGGDEARSA